MFLQCLFIFACFCLDSIVATLFPITPGSQFGIVPSLGICAIVLVVRKLEWRDSFLITAISGLIYSYLFTNTYFLYMIIFLLIMMIVKWWFRSVGDSFFVVMIICSVAIFLKEFFIFVLGSLGNDINISMADWFANRSFLTLAVNLVLFTVIYGLNNLKEYYLKRKMMKMRDDERIRLYRYR